jgi:hypothetical protein
MGADYLCRKSSCTFNQAETRLFAQSPFREGRAHLIAHYPTEATLLAGDRGRPTQKYYKSKNVAFQSWRSYNPRLTGGAASFHTEMRCRF